MRWLNRKMMSTFIVQFVYVIWVFVEVIIILRFILKFFGASGEATFVRWIDGISFSLIHPFWGAFPSAEIEEKFLIEISSLFAILIYWLLAYLIISTVELIEGKKKGVFKGQKRVG